MRYILTVTFFLFYSITFAQNKWNYNYVDSLSYQQYVNNETKELRKTVKKALKNDIDFYYLRMRAGISNYNNKNYEKGLIHFEKAYEMNPADTNVQEYYYYSLLNTLRIADANDLAETFKVQTQNKIGYKNKKVIDLYTSVELVGITSGVILNDNVSKADDDFLEDANYMENTLQNNTYFGSIYLKNKINNRLKFTNSFSLYNVSSLGIVQSPIFATEKREYSNTSYNYVFGSNYEFKKQFHINGFVSLYSEKSNYLSATIDTVDYKIKFNNNSYENNVISGGISVFKRIKNFGFGLDLVMGNMAAVKQFQIGGSVLYYPFGNTNFYSNSSGVYLLNNGVNQSVFSQTFGGLITKNIGYTLKGTYGNHQNFISDNGLNINNTIDPIWITGEANLLFKFRKITLIPSYTFQQRESSYSKFTNFETLTTVKNKYNNHLLKLTLLWNL